MNERQAYINGWRACMAGVDGRYCGSSAMLEEGYTRQNWRDAWMAGWYDAMEAEDDEEPDPAAAGYDEPDTME